jgi:hypothetical protein
VKKIYFLPCPLEENPYFCSPKRKAFDIVKSKDSTKLNAKRSTELKQQNILQNVRKICFHLCR